MKERPILFSGPMVRAILGGQKTQTRRVEPLFPMNRGHVQMLSDGRAEWSPDGGFDRGVIAAKPKYGVAGDRLWVKETFRLAVMLDGKSPHDVEGLSDEANYREAWAPLMYLADGEKRWCSDGRLAAFGGVMGRLRPSIHMPRWASRITLEVVSVRVERLQEISGDDAFAEGVGQKIGMPLVHGHATPEWNRRAFEALWDKINAERGFGWDANPWVWAIEFRRTAQ